MTPAHRIAKIERLSERLAAEVLDLQEAQTLAEHIRDRGAWTSMWMDAEKLRKAVAVWAERERKNER